MKLSIYSHNWIWVDINNCITSLIKLNVFSTSSYDALWLEIILFDETKVLEILKQMQMHSVFSDLNSSVLWPEL